MTPTRRYHSGRDTLDSIEGREEDSGGLLDDQLGSYLASPQRGKSVPSRPPRPARWRPSKRMTDTERV